jgi:DNA-directed RNA polymerase subunit RPC12/RpoP
MNEFKCFDCDQVFLLPAGGKATVCPRCGSDRIQEAGKVKVTIQPAE